ncbi:MAG: IS110 family transposase [Nanoarchaeota archaeon]|nr:IS110 family transposase [Nanoarchaeota archaeon]
MYCGIDVSKGKSNVCLIDSKRNILSEFEIKHDMKGFSKLESSLTPKTKIGMENTGSYSTPIFHYFKNKGYLVCYVDNLKMHNFAKIYNPNIKNDKVDAKLVAFYLASNLTEVQLEKCNELKDLSTLYYKLVQQNTKFKHMFKSQLATIFPELENNFSVLHVKAIPILLLKYPTPKDISNATDEDIYKTMREHVLTRIDMNFAKRLRELAKVSVGVVDYPASCFQMTIRLMLFYNNLTDDMKNRMAASLEKTPYFHLVNTFGYNTIGVSILAGEVGDIRRFANHKKFVRFCGLDVTEHTSGSSINKKSSITKQGNRILRSYFHNQLLCHLSHKTEPSKFYYRLREKGKHPNVCMTAMARKLAVKTYFDMKRCHEPLIL